MAVDTNFRPEHVDREGPLAAIGRPVPSRDAPHARVVDHRVIRAQRGGRPRRPPDAGDDRQVADRDASRLGHRAGGIPGPGVIAGVQHHPVAAPHQLPRSLLADPVRRPRHENARHAAHATGKPGPGRRGGDLSREATKERGASGC
jgi:hypothetical protein